MHRVINAILALLHLDLLELDLLGHGNAVIGDPRRTERLVEDDIAALRAEGDLHGVVEDVHAAEHPFAGIDA
jgi:hypothetical protein